MQTYRRFLLWPIALLASLLVFGFALAYASDGGVPDAGTLVTAVTASTSAWPLTWLTPYMPVLVPVLAGAQSGIVRASTFTTGFWHSKGAHWLLTLFGAIVGAALDFLRKGDLGKTAAIAALGGAVTAFCVPLKITGKVSDDIIAEPFKPAGGGSSGGVAAALFLAMLSCFFAQPGCATAGGGALGACELGKLPQTLQTLVAVVTTALSGATWQQDLTALESSAGGQLDCVVEAVVASMQKRGSISATGLAVVEHGRAWLAQKGHHACDDRSRHTDLVAGAE